MKLKIFISTTLLLITLSAFSQINEFTIKQEGILIPRVDRTAVAGPEESQLIWDINSESFWYYKNSAWVEITTGGGGGGSGGSKIEDADTDTYVDVEKTADIDQISFGMAGSESFLMKRVNGNAILEILNSTNTIIGENAGGSIDATTEYITIIGKMQVKI